MCDFLSLVRKRQDFLVVYGCFGPTISPYTVDFVDKDRMAEILASAGRDYIKQGLQLLCPDFINVFRQMGSISNSKKENAELLKILEHHIENMNSLIDIDDIMRVKADVIYRECEELEGFLMDYKRKNPGWVYTLDADSIRKKEKKLERLAGLDVEEWCLGAVDKVKSDILQTIKNIKPYYEKGISEGMRKWEQRNRDLFFVMIIQGLCFFYDVYEPDMCFSKGYYSIVDILAIRAALKDNPRYPLNLTGFYSCLDSFHRRIEEFEDINFIRVLSGLDDYEDIERVVKNKRVTAYKEAKIENDEEEAEKVFQNIMANFRELRRKREAEIEREKNKSYSSTSLNSNSGYWSNREFIIEEFKP